jgi:hypothetical protein
MFLLRESGGEARVVLLRETPDFNRPALLASGVFHAAAAR